MIFSKFSNSRDFSLLYGSVATMLFLSDIGRAKLKKGERVFFEFFIVHAMSRDAQRFGGQAMKIEN